MLGILFCKFERESKAIPRVHFSQTMHIYAYAHSILHDQSHIPIQRSIPDPEGFKETRRVLFRRRPANREAQEKEVAAGVFRQMGRRRHRRSVCPSKERSRAHHIQKGRFVSLILDTDALVALLKGLPQADVALKRLEENDDQIATTIISAYELLRGAYISSNPEKNLAEVRELLSNMEVIDLTFQACEEAARIYRNLRKSGHLIGEDDVIIAGIAKASGGTLLTRDAHFKLVQGLNTMRW